MEYPCNQSGQFLLFEEDAVIFNKDSRLWRNYLRFHNRNPQAYENFRNNLLARIESGQDFSSRMEAEMTRWDKDSYGKGKNLNINNNHVPYALRMFIEEYPEHRYRFDLRPLRMD